MTLLSFFAGMYIWALSLLSKLYHDLFISDQSSIVNQSWPIIISGVEALGTIFLGIIALWQTKKANGLSARLTKIEENRDEMDRQPSVLLTHWGGVKTDFKSTVVNPDTLYYNISCGLEKSGDDEEIQTLLLYFTNTSNSYTILRLYDVIVTDTSASNFGAVISKWKWSLSNQQSASIAIAPGDTCKIGFWGEKKVFDLALSNRTSMRLHLENRYGQRYIESFDFILAVFSPNSGNESIFTTIVLGNYVIAPIKHADNTINND